MFMQNPIERNSLQTGTQHAHSTFGRCLHDTKTFPYEPGSAIELENNFGTANTTHTQQTSTITTNLIKVVRNIEIIIIPIAIFELYRKVYYFDVIEGDSEIKSTSSTTISHITGSLINDIISRSLIIVNYYHLVLVIIGLLFSVLYESTTVKIRDYGQNLVKVGLLDYNRQTLIIRRVFFIITVRNEILLNYLVLCELSTILNFPKSLHLLLFVGLVEGFGLLVSFDQHDLCFIPILVAVVTVRALYAGTLVTFWTTAPSHQKRRSCSSALLAAFCLLLATLTIAARCYASKNATHPLVAQLSSHTQILSSITTINTTKENKFQTHSSKIVLSRYFRLLPYYLKDTQSDTRVILRNSKNLLSTQNFKINTNFLNAENRKKRELQNSNQEKVYKNYQRYDGKSITDQNSALYNVEQVHHPTRVSDNQPYKINVNSANSNNNNINNIVVSSSSFSSTTSDSYSSSTHSRYNNNNNNNNNNNQATYNNYYNSKNNNKLLRNIPVRNLEAETNSVKFLTDANLIRLNNHSDVVTSVVKNASVGAWNSSVNAPQVSGQSLKPSDNNEEDRITGRTGIERPMPPALDHSNNSLSSESAVLVLVVSAVVLTVALGLVTCVLSHYRGGTAADPHDAGQTPTTAPMLSVVSAGAAAGVGGMDRLRGRGAARELAATRDRQGRLHPLHTDIAINLPPNIALPDGEDHPFSSSRLQIRDPEQESEIYQKCIKPPPNRTVLESESPPPYRSSSAGLLGSIGSSSSGSSDWSGGSAPLVMRCHSMSSSTSKRPEAGPSGQKTDFIQRTVKIFTGKKSQPPPAPTLPAVVVPTRPRQTTSEQQQQHQNNSSSGRPKPSV